jgi:hypothetical protein
VREMPRGDEENFRLVNSVNDMLRVDRCSVS